MSKIKVVATAIAALFLGYVAFNKFYWYTPEHIREMQRTMATAELIDRVSHTLDDLADALEVSHREGQRRAIDGGYYLDERGDLLKICRDLTVDIKDPADARHFDELNHRDIQESRKLALKFNRKVLKFCDELWVREPQ